MEAELHQTVYVLLSENNKIFKGNYILIFFFP